MNDKVLDFYELLKTNKSINETNYKDFCNIVVDIAKQDLHIGKVAVEYDEFDKNNGGYANNNHICVNKKEISFRTLNVFVNTLFHELRHIYQKKKPLYKQFDKQMLPSFRPVNVGNNTFVFIDEESVGISPFDLYILAVNEEDARKYATKKTQEFLFALKELADNDEHTFFLKRYLDKQIIKSKLQDERENRKFKNALHNIEYSKNSIDVKSYYYVKQALRDNEENKKNIYSQGVVDNVCITKISALTNFYSNDKINDLILKTAYNNNDPYLLSCLVNSLSLKTSKELFDDCIKMFVDNGIGYEKVEEKLCNWDPVSLVIEYTKRVNETKSHKENDDENNIVVDDENVLCS